MAEVLATIISLQRCPRLYFCPAVNIANGVTQDIESALALALAAWWAAHCLEDVRFSEPSFQVKDANMGINFQLQVKATNKVFVHYEDSSARVNVLAAVFKSLVFVVDDRKGNLPFSAEVLQQKP